MFLIEHRQIAWAALVATVLWGVYGFSSMPQRKDSDIPVRVAVAACEWPGATAQDVEQLVTRPIEQAIAEKQKDPPIDWRRLRHPLHFAAGQVDRLRTTR